MSARDWIVAAALLAALTQTHAALAQAPSEESIHSTALELYRYRLLWTGSRIRFYPDAAVTQSLEGTAILDLAIAPDGSLKDMQLISSSGYALLDDAARETLARALPLTEIPAALQNKAFNMRVVIVFKLPD